MAKSAPACAAQSAQAVTFTDTVAFAPLDAGNAAVLDFVERTVHVAQGQTLPFVGVILQPFEAPYRGVHLRHKAGDRILADAELRKFLDANGARIKWSDAA